MEKSPAFTMEFYLTLRFADNSLFEWYGAGIPLQRLVLFLAYAYCMSL